MSEKRRVNFLTLTYPEDRERVEHLASLVMSGQYEVCWCVHDRDTLEDGSPEKPHCHCVVHLNNGMTKSAFCRNFSIRERMVKACSVGDEIEDLDGALLYLIHADHTSKSLGKYRYPLEKIKGPYAEQARSRIKKLLNRKKDSILNEADSFLHINCFIDSSLYLTMSQLATWCAQNGHWACFRRSSSIFRDIMRDHNAYLDKLNMQREIASIGERAKERRDIEGFYEAVGIRALQSLDSLLESAGRPSLKLKKQIADLDSLAYSSSGRANVEMIRYMLRNEPIPDSLKSF